MRLLYLFLIPGAWVGILVLSPPAMGAGSPLVNSPHPSTNVTIRLSDFENFAPGHHSDWQAMLLALQACAQKHASVLEIPHRTYRFNDPAILLRQGGGHIELRGLSDFTLNGNGSTFVFYYPRDGFDFYECKRVLLQNLKAVWNFDLAAPGKVQMVNGKKVIVVDAIYPITPKTPVQAVTEYDTTGMKWKMKALEVYRPSVEMTAPQTLASPGFSIFPAGDTVAVREFVYAARGFEFSFNDNADLTFDHITVENCPGMAFVGYGADRGFAFRNCTIQRRDPRHDLVSTGADGIHVGMSRGDCIIQNCQFSYLGDDSVNIHSIWMNLVSVVNGRVAKVSTTVYDPTYLSPGDELQFLDGSLKPEGSAHIAGSTYDQGSRTQTITFRETLPAKLAAGTVIADLNRGSDRYEITNNNFHDSRARGIMVQASDGVVQKNTIRNVMGAAIQLTADHAEWNEGYGCHDVVVSGNVCDGCNYGYWGGFKNEPGVCLGVINVFAQNSTGVANSYVHRNIEIFDNTISNTPNLAFFLSSVENLRLTNNIVQNCPASAIRAVFVSRAAQLALSGNRAIHCSIKPEEGIYLEQKTNVGVKVSGNTGF